MSSVFRKAELLSLSCISQQEFKKRYKQIGIDNLYLQVLHQLKEAVEEDNLEYFHSLTNLVNAISAAENAKTLKALNEDSDNPIKDSNVVILACKYGRVKILKQLLSDNNNTLKCFSLAIGRDIKADDVDEEYHNAYYYAIRSGNLDLLDLLTSKLPCDCLGINMETEDLDVLLATAYEELKVSNVLMSKETHIFVQDKLISLRFFSNNSQHLHPEKPSVVDVKDRINLVVDNIIMLRNQYSDKEEDETFILTAKFIAKNIYVLKRQIKSTYSILPWEEIEFCVIIFITVQQNFDEMNLLYRVCISKTKLLKYLDVFAEQLELQTNNLTEQVINSSYPLKDRHEVMENIIATIPEFEDLYTDYEQIRDLYSLKQIEEYIDVALENSNDEQELLIIERTLQVIGENTKNTLMSPRLSDSTSNFIFMSFPENIRKMFIDMRNSLSHSHSHFKRIEIQNSKDSNFLNKVKEDLRKIKKFVVAILIKRKIKVADELIGQFDIAKDLEEVERISKLVTYSDLTFETKNNETHIIMEHDNLKQLLEQLRVVMNDPTKETNEKFDKINDMLTSDSRNLQEYKMNYKIKLIKLSTICVEMCARNPGTTLKLKHTNLKFFLNSILNDTIKIDHKRNKYIADLIMEIIAKAILHVKNDEYFKLFSVVSKVIDLTNISLYNRIQSIKLFQRKLFICKKKKESFLPNSNRGMGDELLREKVGMLRKVLSSLDLYNIPAINRFVNCKKNKRNIVALEMLVLDILSILSETQIPSKLSTNSLCVDDNAPIFIGRELRNYLAHCNPLANILDFDLNVAVISNALNLIKQELVGHNKIIGKEVASDLLLLKKRYKRNLDIINKKQTLFGIMEYDNIEKVKISQQGTDIFSRDKDGLTAVHYAVKGNNVDAIVNMFDNSILADASNRFKQSPLHVAASCNNTQAISTLMLDNYVDVNCKNHFEETPLHLAALHGQNMAVQLLLKYDADYNAVNSMRHKPIHSAILNNHLSTVKLLLRKDNNIDSNITFRGLNPLHLASLIGSSQIVDLLIQNKANVNAKSIRNFTPLHAASTAGNISIVETLISHKASINAVNKFGLTALHYALQCSNEDIAITLVRHGSKINIADCTFRSTPLHFAAHFRCEKATRILLEEGASIDETNIDGLTALHFAVSSSSQNIVELLLKNNANVNAKNKHGLPALHYAVANNEPEIVLSLLKYGAILNYMDNKDVTPILTVAARGGVDMIKLLLSKGADLKSKCTNGDTLLHIAAERSNMEIVNFLLENNAFIDERNNIGMTPLHKAIVQGHIDVIEAFLARGADVNAKDDNQLSSLHIAAKYSSYKVVESLIKAGANVDYKTEDGLTPLMFHIKRFDCNKDIMEILISESSNISVEETNILLRTAIKFNYKNIIELLLDKGPNINIQEELTVTAISCGFADIVDLLMRKFKNKIKNITNLMLNAAVFGYSDIIEIIIQNDIDINRSSAYAIPLHVACRKGHVDVVKMLLLNDVDVNATSDDGFTTLHMAVKYGHNDVTEILINNGANVDAPTRNNWKALHFAAQSGDLNAVNFLVDNGANMHVKNDFGLKPIHIAACNGHENVVKYFLTKGMSLMDRDAHFATLLHIVACSNNTNLVSYLIAKGIDINVKDGYNRTPIHYAIVNDSVDVLELLIKYGATYNYSDLTDNGNAAKLLQLTSRLFETITINKFSEVSKIVKEGAFINAKDVDGNTPLHYAVIKGFDECIKVLLENQANPNVTNEFGRTPLHYASKFSYDEIAKNLLSFGAIYNAKDNMGKKPEDFAQNSDLCHLLHLVSRSFQNVQNNNCEVINDIKNIKDIDTLKCIMNARNSKNKTLIVVAMLNDFSNIKELKELATVNDCKNRIAMAYEFIKSMKYEAALSILKEVFEESKGMLGANNPITLDTQMEIGNVLHRMMKYQEALDVLEDTYVKQMKVLGEDNKDVLMTQFKIALVLQSRGKYIESLTILEKNYKKQKEVLGEDYEAIVFTKSCIAVALDSLGQYEKALKINHEVYQYFNEKHGYQDVRTLTALSNIAMSLTYLGDLENALEAHVQVFVLTIPVLGMYHLETLRRMQLIALPLIDQHKYDKALEILKTVYEMQNNLVGPDHWDTLNSESLMGDVFFRQGQVALSLEMHKKCFEKRKAILGVDHPVVVENSLKISECEMLYASMLSLEIPQIATLRDTKFSEIATTDLLRTQELTNQLYFHIQNNNLNNTEDCINRVGSVNVKNDKGLTPLHYAALYGNRNIIEMLLTHGADPTEKSKDGYTALHFAVTKDNKEIVKILLEDKKVKEFINFQSFADGSTALHVASKKRSYDIVKNLLARGAIYNKVDFINKRRPLDFSINQNVTKLFKLLDQMFQFAEKGNVKIISILKELDKDRFLAVTRALNHQEQTLLIVLLKNRHADIARELGTLLQSQ